MANRKGPQQGAGFSFGGGTVQQTQASGFGTFGQQNKPAASTFGGENTIAVKHSKSTLHMSDQMSDPSQSRASTQGT